MSESPFCRFMGVFTIWLSVHIALARRFEITEQRLRSSVT